MGFLESDFGFLKSDLGSVELAESNLGCADVIKSEMHWKRGITNLCRQYPLPIADICDVAGRTALW